jgi:hypothetical protein
LKKDERIDEMYEMKGEEKKTKTDKYQARRAERMWRGKGKRIITFEHSYKDTRE